MNSPFTIETKVHFSRARGGRKVLARGEEAPPAAPPQAIPRIARLMALAIRFDRLIREGVVKDYAELARLGGVSRARITQIMNLLNLPPGEQERLLFLEGREGPGLAGLLRARRGMKSFGLRH